LCAGLTDIMTVQARQEVIADEQQAQACSNILQAGTFYFDLPQAACGPGILLPEVKSHTASAVRGLMRLWQELI